MPEPVYANRFHNHDDRYVKLADAAARGIFDAAQKPYNAKPNGANVRSRIQRAIDDAVANGGGLVTLTVAGTYKVQITEATTDTSPPSDGQHCLVIDGDDVTLFLGPGVVLDCYPLGGDPDTNWEVVGGAVWRGGGIFVTGGAAYATRRQNVTITGGGEIRGNFTYTGDHTWPANTVTGGGWDTTHKGIWFENDTYHDNHVVRDIHIWGFSGEIIYSGGGDAGASPVLGRFLVEHVHAHETNGSIVSMTGRHVTVRGCHLHTSAGNGIENGYSDGWQEISGNRIHDTDLDGISVFAFDTSGIGHVDIHHNELHSIDTYGLGLFSVWNGKVHHNTIRDCTTGGIRQEISGSYNTTARDIDICDNLVLADTRDMSVGISIGYNTGEATNVRIRRNRIGSTVDGTANGFTVAEAFSGYPSTDWYLFDITDNEYVGDHGDSSDRRIFRYELTPANTLLTVAQLKPPIKALVEVLVTLEATAACNVWVKISGVDQAGDTGITITLAPNPTALVAGLYSYPAYIVECGARQTVKVEAQSDTASTVYVSAVLREV